MVRLSCSAQKTIGEEIVSFFLEETDYKSINGLQLLDLLILSNELNYVTKYFRK